MRASTAEANEPRPSARIWCGHSRRPRRKKGACPGGAVGRLLWRVGLGEVDEDRGAAPPAPQRWGRASARATPSLMHRRRRATAACSPPRVSFPFRGRAGSRDWPDLCQRLRGTRGAESSSGAASSPSPPSSHSGRQRMANLATVKHGRWSFRDVEVKDISLEDYIACKAKYAQFCRTRRGAGGRSASARPSARSSSASSARSCARAQQRQEGDGRADGEARLRDHPPSTDPNPVQVFVEAVVNCRPRRTPPAWAAATRCAARRRRLAAAASELGDLPHRDGLARAGLPQHQDDRRVPRRRDHERRECALPSAADAADAILRTRRNCRRRGSARLCAGSARPPLSAPTRRRSAVSFPLSSQGSSNSYAIKKKDELERVAKSNR